MAESFPCLPCSRANERFLFGAKHESMLGSRSRSQAIQAAQMESGVLHAPPSCAPLPSAVALSARTQRSTASRRTLAVELNGSDSTSICIPPSPPAETDDGASEYTSPPREEALQLVASEAPQQPLGGSAAAAAAIHADQLVPMQHAHALELNDMADSRTHSLSIALPRGLNITSSVIQQPSSASPSAPLRCMSDVITPAPVTNAALRATRSTAACESQQASLSQRSSSAPTPPTSEAVLFSQLIPTCELPLPGVNSSASDSTRALLAAANAAAAHQRTAAHNRAARQRLFIAVSIALRWLRPDPKTSKSARAQLLRRAQKLALPTTDSACVPLGHSFIDSELRSVAEQTALPPLPSLCSPPFKEKVDGALRELLRCHFAAAEGCGVLPNLLLRFAAACDAAVQRSNAVDPAYVAHTAAATARSGAGNSAASATATLLPVSAAGNSCAFRCISLATLVPLTAVNDSVLRPTLDSITEPTTLYSYGLPGVEWDSSASEVAAAKATYLSSGRFAAQDFGGELELCLAAHFSKGALAFLLLDTTANKLCVKTLCSAEYPFDAAAGASIGTRLVCLHHCSFVGGNAAQEVVTAPQPPRANHFNFFYFTSTAGALVRSIEPQCQEALLPSLQSLARMADEQAAAQAAAERVHQQALLQDCLRSEQQLQHQRQSQPPQEAPQAPVPMPRRPATTRGNSSPSRKSARAQPRPPPLARPSAAPHPHNPMRRTSSTTRAAAAMGFGASAPRAATVQPASVLAVPAHTVDSSVFQPLSVRPHMWSVIPSHSQAHFLGLAEQLFARYATYSSSGDYRRCAELLHIILDLPARALHRASLKPTRRSMDLLNRSMERTAHQVAVELQLLDAHFEQARAASIAAASAAALQSSIKGVAAAAAAQLFHAASAEASTAHSLPLQDSGLQSTSAAVTASRCVELPSTAVPTTLPSSASTADPLTRNVRRAVRILREGGARCISRAARALLQSQPACIDDDVLLALRALHPRGDCALPLPPATAAPPELMAVDPLTLARLLKHRVDNGSAPGPSGWTGSHLQLLVDSGERDAISGLCMLTKDLCNGVFTGGMQKRLLACVLQPIEKPGSRAGSRAIRPIAMGETFVKLAEHYCMSLIEELLPNLFPRIQYGVARPGGSETAAHLTRATLEQLRRTHSDTIALKTDFRNAFNTASRQRVWQRLLACPETAPIWRMFHWAYGCASPLLLYDSGRLTAELESTEGVRQGDVFAGLGFSLLVQPLYEAALRRMPDGHAFSIQDDLTLIGPHTQVLSAFEYIRTHCAQLGLELRVDKCAVYVPSDATAVCTPPTQACAANAASPLSAGNSAPAQTATAACAATHADSTACRGRILSACAVYSLPVEDSLSSLGVLFGPAAAVVQHCHSAVAKHRAFFDALTHAEMPVQMAFLLLRHCGVPRMSYLARTVHPLQLLPAAMTFDHAVLDCFHRLMQTQAAASSGTSTLTPAQLQLQLQLPLRVGGMGLRAVTFSSPSAYFAALAAAMPELAAELISNSRTLTPASATSTLPAAARFMMQSTAAFEELHCCWAIMQKQGVGTLPARTLDEPAPPDRPPSSPPPAGTVPSSGHQMTLRGPDVPARLLTRALAHAHSLIAHRAACSTPITSTQQPLPAACATSPSGLIPLPFLDQEKLQRQATHEIEELTLGRLHAELPPFHQARLTALSAPHAAAFLTALPTLSELQLDDVDMRLAIRLRLGLPAADHLPTQQCVCERAGSTGSVFAADPEHLHSCLLTRGNALTLRHNHVAICLARLATSAGFHVVREPMHHVRPNEASANDGRQAVTANAGAESRDTAAAAAAAAASALEDEPDDKREPAGSASEPSSRGFDRHADLLLIRGGTQLYVDVSITRPTKASSLAASSAVRSDTLVCARQVAAAKHRKYDAIAAANGYKMLPFVLECYGGVGTEATRTLRFLSAAAAQPRAFLRHAQQALSVCLQKGNAQVALLGQAALHLRRQQQQRTAAGMHSSWSRWQHTGCASQQPPPHNAHLHYTLDPQLSEAAVQGHSRAEGMQAQVASMPLHFAFRSPPVCLSAAPLLSRSPAVQQQGREAVQQQQAA
jgi:hypothetical protein